MSPGLVEHEDGVPEANVGSQQPILVVPDHPLLFEAERIDEERSGAIEVVVPKQKRGHRSIFVPADSG